MKVLVAIEDRFDASAMVEAIRNRSWPSFTEFILVHVIDVGAKFGQDKLLECGCAGNDYTTDSECNDAFHLLMRTGKQIKSFLPDATTETYVCYGEPTEELLGVFGECHPNVVVIGKHTRNKLLRIFRPDVGEALMKVLPKESVDAIHVVEVPPIKKLLV